MTARSPGSAGDGLTIADLGAIDDAHVFLDGSRRARAALPSVGIGLGIYAPGWRWSVHAGPQTGRSSERHIGYVQSGAMRVRAADGGEATVTAGQAFEVGPGHDAWVVGDTPCVALDVTPT